jgi:hypothetical protein
MIELDAQALAVHVLGGVIWPVNSVLCRFARARAA